MAVIVLSAINAKWIHPSLALRLLKANLPPDLRTDENCAILEFALRQRQEEQVTAILAEKPKILALSVSIWNHGAALELLKALEKERSPEAEKPVVILGGPEITFLPPDAEIFKYADFAVRGEGETVFAGICRAVLEDVQAAKKQYGKFIVTNPVNSAAINNAYDYYTNEDLQHKLVYVESSRGCPYNCAFCQSAVKSTEGKNLGYKNADTAVVPFNPVREFPLEPFLGNLEKLLQRSIKTGGAKTRTIKFLDRSFNVNVPRTLAILEFCHAKTIGIKNENKFQFHFEMVPGLFPKELLAMLAKFPPGSIRLEIGIQSFNPVTCRLIKRFSNPGSEVNALCTLRETTNAIIHADLIAGLPGEGLASFAEGFDRLWLALSAGHNSVPFEIQPGILKILPGTPIYAMAEEGGFSVKYNKTAPYEVMETDCLPASDMDKIKNYARFWELIVNRRPFPGMLPALAPYGKPVFYRFLELSQKLLEHFGRNWGIAKKELEEAVKQGEAFPKLQFLEKAQVI